MRTAHALLLAVAATTCAMPAFADEAALAARLDKMSTELEALKAELKALKAEKAAAPSATSGQISPAPVAATTTLKPAIANDSGAQTPLPYAMAPGSPFATATGGTGLTFFGYGEINYANYPRNRSQTQADLARAVIGVGYRFDDRTRFVSEFGCGYYFLYRRRNAVAATVAGA